MTDHIPPTDQRLDAIEARVNARRTALSGWINCYSPMPEQEALENAEAVLEEDVPVLVAEVRRLRAPADRVRALAILEAADFLRDAHHRDGLTVQEIGTALRHTADEADPMVGSLARDGFGLDEIADMLSRPAVPAAVETGE